MPSKRKFSKKKSPPERVRSTLNPRPGSRWRLAAIAVGLCALACTPPPDHNHRRTILAFGTVIDVEVIADPTLATRALDDVENYLLRLHRDWYAFGDGELGRINAKLARGLEAELSPELQTLVTRALELRDATSGAFDPTIGELVELWGFADQNSARAEPPPDDSIKEWLEVAEDRRAVRVQGGRVSTNVQLQLDLSAMAKGAALEGTAQILRQHGVGNAIIDAGGDIKALGSRGDRLWQIGIQHPREEKVLARIAVNPGEAIVSSGDYRRFFESGQRRFHHLIDPRTGRPVRDTMAVTVIGPDATVADAAATALMVGGSKEFDEITQALRIEAALLITAAGEIIMSEAMADRVLAPAGAENRGERFKPQL